MNIGDRDFGPPPSLEALSRFLAVSLVLSREHNGEERAEAIDAVAAEKQPTADRASRRRSARSLRLSGAVGRGLREA